MRKYLLSALLATTGLVLGLLAPLHAKTVILTEEDNHTQAVLNAGDTLVVRLIANPSTGYSWAVAGDPGPALKAVGVDMVHNGAGKVGAPGHQLFRFHAEVSGSSSLTLRYRRPFEKGAKPAREFAATIVVDEGDRGQARAASGGAEPRVLVGHYRGLLPCGDCSGIETDLWLYVKGAGQVVETHYKMTMAYQGKNRSFDETGTWTIAHGIPDDPAATVLELKPDKGSAVQSFLRLSDTELAALGGDRKRLPPSWPSLLRRAE